MPLNPGSFMECRVHGIGKPAFVCQHLQHGVGVGFFSPNDPPTQAEPWKQGWCAACEDVRSTAGGWNDESEAYASVRLVCDGCFDDARGRNFLASTSGERTPWRRLVRLLSGG
jgi:hypothetical protein